MPTETIQQIVARLDEERATMKEKELDERKQSLMEEFCAALPDILDVLAASDVSVVPTTEPRPGLVFAYKEASVFAGIEKNAAGTYIHWFEDAPSFPLDDITHFAKFLHMLLISKADSGYEFGEKPTRWCFFAATLKAKK